MRSADVSDFMSLDRSQDTRSLFDFEAEIGGSGRCRAVD